MAPSPTERDLQTSRLRDLREIDGGLAVPFKIENGGEALPLVAAGVGLPEKRAETLLVERFQVVLRFDRRGDHCKIQESRSTFARLTIIVWKRLDAILRSACLMLDLINRRKRLDA